MKETLYCSRCGGESLGSYCIHHPADGMAHLRGIFPDGQADEMNFVLFSTSGVHGSYCTIEDVEKECAEGPGASLTYLVVHPRIVRLAYGNCTPRGPEDFAFLRRLRASSHEAVSRIGRGKAEERVARRDPVDGE